MEYRVISYKIPREFWAAEKLSSKLLWQGCADLVQEVYWASSLSF